MPFWPKMRLQSVDAKYLCCYGGRQTWRNERGTALVAIKLHTGKLRSKCKLQLRYRTARKNAEVILCLRLDLESLFSKPINHHLVISGHWVVFGLHFLCRDDFAVSDAALKLSEIAHFQRDRNIERSLPLGFSQLLADDHRGTRWLRCFGC